MVKYHKIWIITICFLYSQQVIAQSHVANWSVRNAENRQTINLSDKNPDWLLHIAYNVHLPMAPKPLSVLKDSIYRDIQRPPGIKHLPAEKDLSAIEPVVSLSFYGGESFAVPNDDYIAVSKDGKVVATQNNLISVFDEEGNLLVRKSLRIFSGSPSITKIFDPRIIYDESMDRFILVYLSGNNYETNKVQLAFSGSSDPSGEWYHYSFSGNPFNDSTWHDYPSIAVCGTRLFITFNTFRNNSVNNSGFKQSVIWEIDKQKGYNNVPADEMNINILQNITYNSSFLFSIHPVIGSPDTCMYFLSNNALSTKSDNNFLLLKLDTDTLLPLPDIRLLSSSLPYQLPPDALQKNTNWKLNTNDARIQDSFYLNKSISFVLNSGRIIADGLIPGVYFGQLHDIPNGQITGEFLEDTLETAFATFIPVHDNGYLFCYNYSSASNFPGISAVYRDKQGRYSRPVNIIEGNDHIQFWGDYNKICKRPGNLDAYWLSAGYGFEDGTISGGELATCIARILLPGTTGDYETPYANNQMNLFPNPSGNNKITTIFNLKQSQVVEISIYNMSGTLINTVSLDQMPSGTHRISFSTAFLIPGTYILSVKGQKEPPLAKKFIVEKK